MIANRDEQARLQSDFYRDQYLKLLRWTMRTIIIIFFLIAGIIYIILFQPSTSFYANTVSGKILPMPEPQ